MSEKSNLYGSDPQGAANKIADEGLANDVEIDIHGEKDSRADGKKGGEED